MKPTLENLEELLNAACNSGGSGQGISHYKMANACGMRAHLALSNAIAAQGGANDCSQADPNKPNSLRLGSAYHKLHEWWSEGALDHLEGFMAIEFEDISFTLAMAYFESYVSAFSKRAWGQVLKNEWQLPESDDNKKKTRALFQHAMLTAKPDRVVMMNEQDVRTAYLDRDLRLPGPGVYVIDFKTSGVDHDELYWQTSPQALWYPHAVRLENPQWDVQGMIFDVIRKPRRKADSVSFEAYFVPMHENPVGKLFPFVTNGAKNIEDAKTWHTGNITECVKSNFGRDEVCPYYGAQCAFTRKSA